MEWTMLCHVSSLEYTVDLKTTFKDKHIPCVSSSKGQGWSPWGRTLVASSQTLRKRMTSYVSRWSRSKLLYHKCFGDKWRWVPSHLCGATGVSKNWSHFFSRVRFFRSAFGVLGTDCPNLAAQAILIPSSFAGAMSDVEAAVWFLRSHWLQLLWYFYLRLRHCRSWKPQCSTRHFELNNPLWCVVSVYVLSFNPALLFATYHEGGSMGKRKICLDCFGRLNPNNFTKWHPEVAQKNNFYIVPKFPGVHDFPIFLNLLRNGISFHCLYEHFLTPKLPGTEFPCASHIGEKYLGIVPCYFVFWWRIKKKVAPLHRPRSSYGFFEKPISGWSL